MVDLFHKILVANPEKRADMDTLRLDPWVNDFNLDPPIRIYPKSQIMDNVRHYITGITHEDGAVTFNFHDIAYTNAENPNNNNHTMPNTLNTNSTINTSNNNGLDSSTNSGNRSESLQKLSPDGVNNSIGTPDSDIIRKDSDGSTMGRRSSTPRRRESTTSTRRNSVTFRQDMRRNSSTTPTMRKEIIVSPFPFNAINSPMNGNPSPIIPTISTVNPVTTTIHTCAISEGHDTSFTGFHHPINECRRCSCPIENTTKSNDDKSELELKKGRARAFTVLGVPLTPSEILRSSPRVGRINGGGGGGIGIGSGLPDRLVDDDLLSEVMHSPSLYSSNSSKSNHSSRRSSSIDPDSKSRRPSSSEVLTRRNSSIPTSMGGNGNGGGGGGGGVAERKKSLRSPDIFSSGISDLYTNTPNNNGLRRTSTPTSNRKSQDSLFSIPPLQPSPLQAQPSKPRKLSADTKFISALNSRRVSNEMYKFNIDSPNPFTNNNVTPLTIDRSSMNESPKTLTYGSYPNIFSPMKIEEWHTFHRPAKTIRSIRFPLSHATTSTDPPHKIFQNIEQCLLAIQKGLNLEGSGGNLTFERMNDLYLLSCELKTIQHPKDIVVSFTIEICKVWLLNIHGIKIKRKEGDALIFRELYKQLVGLMQLVKKSS